MDRLNPEHENRLKKALGMHAILFMRDPKKELDDARVLRYWKQLEPFDIEIVEAALFALEGKLRKFPLPVDIVEKCDELLAKQGRGTAVPNPRPPGAQPWCDEPGCDDTGWVTVYKTKRELRPELYPHDDQEGDRPGTAVRKCDCWSINPVKRWRDLQNRAGVIRREEKSHNNWSPDRRGQLVPFRRQG